jgi:uncharacterized low-complexity protein
MNKATSWLDGFGPGRDQPVHPDDRQEDARDAAPHATCLLHRHAPNPVGAVEAQRLREGAADDHEQEGGAGEGPVGNQADHRVEGLGGEGVGEAHQNTTKAGKIMFPIFDDFDYTRGNERWKGKSKRTVEQRRGDKADRLFEKLVKGTDFERLDGYHALRHSFISILVAQGKTWDQTAAFVGHLDQKTTQRYIHFMPKDKRETANSIPFEF